MNTQTDKLSDLPCRSASTSGSHVRRIIGFVALAILLLARPAAAQRPSPLPPLPDNQITFAQITGARPLDLGATGGTVGFVWSGNAPSRTALGSRYYPIDRDLDRSHTADWYRANHPDRLVYECDRTTPAIIYHYAWGAYSTIDISNPATRQYILSRFVAPALASGKNVIALDNVSLRNSAHACGVFRNGQWVQLYSGKAVDPAYSASVLDYVSWLAGEIHARGGLLALNAKVDPADTDGTRRLIALGDIWLDEAATSRGCKGRISGQLWQTKFDLARWAANTMGWIDLEKTCAVPDDLSSSEANWVVANFLLVRGAHSYLAAVKDGVPAAPIRYPAALNPPVGEALGAPYPIDGGWARDYTNGLVIVNPSTDKSLRFGLPAGQWTQGNGQPAASSIALPPTSAAIVLGHRG